jgi:hypothetical protein
MNRPRDHGPHARHRIRQRDQPQPTHVGPREHPDVAGAAPLGARDALVLGVDGDVAQERVVLMTAEALHQNPGAPRGIDDGADPCGALDAIRAREAERHASRVEGCIEKALLLAHRDSAPRGMAQEDLVESFPQDLERLRGRGLHGGLEIGILFGGAVGTTEAGAPLPDESGGGDRLFRTERLEDLVAPRQLRFADVEAWEPLALQQEDPPPAPRQGGGGAGAARSPAHDRCIEIPPRARHAADIRLALRQHKGLPEAACASCRARSIDSSLPAPE